MFLRRALMSLLAVVAGAVVLVGTGCGDASPGPARELDLDRLPPGQVLARAGDALRRVRSYHIEGFNSGPDGRMDLAGEFTASGSGRLRMGFIDGRRLDTIVAGPRVFWKANAAFWRNAGASPSAVRLMAGRWVRPLSASERRFRSVISKLRPRSYARCLTAPSSHGTLHNEGVKTIAGQRVVVLRDSGERPGTSPGELHIAASGRPVPVRSIQRIGTQNASLAGPCGDEDSTNFSSDLRLSRFDRPIRIVAPADVIDLAATTGRRR